MGAVGPNGTNWISVHLPEQNDLSFSLLNVFGLGKMGFCDLLMALNCLAIYLPTLSQCPYSTCPGLRACLQAAGNKVAWTSVVLVGAPRSGWILLLYNVAPSWDFGQQCPFHVAWGWPSGLAAPHHDLYPHSRSPPTQLSPDLCSSSLRHRESLGPKCATRQLQKSRVLSLTPHLQVPTPPPSPTVASAPGWK